MKAVIRQVLNTPATGPASILERLNQLNSTSLSAGGSGGGGGGGGGGGFVQHQRGKGKDKSSGGGSVTSTSGSNSITSPSPSRKKVKGTSSGASVGVLGIDGSITGPSKSSYSKASLHTNIPILEVHPAHPILGYVDYLGQSANATATATATATAAEATTARTNNVEKQRIILQNYITNYTLRIITIADIAQSWLVHNKQKQEQKEIKKEITPAGIVISPEAIQKACHELGLIKSIQFLDTAVLHRHSGYNPGLGNETNIPTSSSPSDPTAAFSSSSLIIQWPNRIIICPITSFLSSTDGSTGGDANIPSSTTIPILEITQTQLNKSKPSSKPIPIHSTDIIAIGCSDGAVRFFSRSTGKNIKSVRGPNGRSDAVVGLVTVNPWNYDTTTTSNGSTSDVDKHSDEVDNNTTVPKKKQKVKTRLLTICASGTAYLWEFQIQLDKVVGQHQKDMLNIIPPLAKFYGRIDQSSNNTSSSSSSSISSSTTTTSSSSSLIPPNISLDQYKVQYDPEREILLWTIGNNIAGSSSSSSSSTLNVLVWDMRHQSLPPHSSETPIYRPKSIIQINPHDVELLGNNISGGGGGGSVGGGGGGGGDGIISSSMKRILIGELHPAFPNDSLYSVVGSKNGGVTIMSAALDTLGGSDNDDNDQNNNKDTTRNGGGKSSTVISKRKSVIYHNFKFASMKRSVAPTALGLIKSISEDKITLLRMATSPSRPDIIILATNYGIIVVDVKAEDSLVTGTYHSSFSNKAGSGGYVGAGNNVVVVRGSSVYIKNINFSPTMAAPNPMGKIRLKDSVLVYRSPEAMHKSVEFQRRPVRIPPNLLPSPSGKFLCLFWHAEKRYEIIHVGSMVEMLRRPSTDDSDYPPAVDTGVNVLSFAWVGDEDAFALLHPPELTKPEAHFLSPNSQKEKKSLKKRNMEGSELDDENDRVDPSKYNPRVELKILVGVNANAVELGGSIAAATATILGDITLRGRHLPTCLFGGPVLCVGSLSQDGETSQADGMAYFYSQKDPTDNRAASYTSVGPTLPYPDLVVWDDIGKLCAVIVGRRVAIYLADPPNFTILGTAFLGSAAETDARVESAKFVHGVLYCTTQCSVQCIFLGNLENDDIVCETDIFTLTTTTTVDSISPNSSIEPKPVPMNLYKPSILTYHQGSLLVSSSTGVHAVPLSAPLVRIGSLLAAGHRERAMRWFDAISPTHHEALANFLERRGVPDLAVQLMGLSLETRVDICLQYGMIEPLVNLINAYGFKGLRQIDNGRGINGPGSHSVMVCIGAFLLSEERVESVQSLISYCISEGESGRKEAFTLAGLLFNVDPEAGRQMMEYILMQQADETKSIKTWQVSALLRDIILKSSES